MSVSFLAKPVSTEEKVGRLRTCKMVGRKGKTVLNGPVYTSLINTSSELHMAMKPPRTTTHATVNGTCKSCVPSLLNGE